MEIIQKHRVEGEDYINKIPTIIILNIINHVDDNVDLVCLLLSCKRLFQFSTTNNHYHQLSFKHIEFNYPLVSSNYNETIKSFTLPHLHLGSFSRMFTNTFSDTMILSNQVNIKDKERIDQNRNNEKMTKLVDELFKTITTTESCKA
ncbi:hypothetical protein DFA_02071 [Cavenderia fasciculata]|uniref:F-box domain-containing protein n=1 Tax=Cavenderia fasciculata TaxID=261658 RepID=F4PYL8_CACFS|nr:uncharacterized protein DFA_02071 [Cavenderia fasciculata]EGG19284.1 hypothetical protein DFA_02071 [Cavenderia fasciculata]|eukprot:XP_004357555.1 hypothetical protein DFA_02071 [Cavenderia fasciculata]